MTLERALSKLERNGYDHDKKGQIVRATRKNNPTHIELMLSKDKQVVACRTMGPGEKDAPEYNRLAGTWYPNVTQAIRELEMQEFLAQRAKA